MLVIITHENGNYMYERVDEILFRKDSAALWVNGEVIAEWSMIQINAIEVFNDPEHIHYEREKGAYV